MICIGGRTRLDVVVTSGKRNALRMVVNGSKAPTVLRASAWLTVPGIVLFSELGIGIESWKEAVVIRNVGGR